MAEPDWSKLMFVLYEKEGRVRYPRIDSDDFDLADFNYSEDHPFQQIDLNKYEIDDAVSYLRRADLVVSDEKRVDLPKEHDGSFRTINGIALNERGFDVAHERELAKRRDRTNTALVVFTFTLVLVGLVGNWPDPAVQKIGGVLVLFLLGGVVYWTDLLDLPSL